MSHPEQLAFFRVVARANEGLLRGARALEVGAYDVNGSVRGVFAAVREHVGIDLREGPGVDEVSFGHEVGHPDGSYDVVLSGECFEHDPHWPKTLTNMARLARPGGLVVFTCASAGRPEHGTRRSDVAESPGTSSIGLDHYENLTEADVRAHVDLPALFSVCAFWYLPTSFDLYFAGVRRGTTAGAASAVLPADAEVRDLARLMPTSHRLARLPLRVLRRLVPDPLYQDFAVPYWRLLLGIQDRVAQGRFRRPGADEAPPARNA